MKRFEDWRQENETNFLWLIIYIFMVSAALDGITSIIKLIKLYW